MLPGEGGPVEARTADGARADLFDLADYLSAEYRRIYVVDLEGVERNLPQLDYLAELTRDTDVWIDAGVRSADAVIDVLVTGARRAVVSPSRLRGPNELRRALKLTPELALELEFSAEGRLVTRPEWGSDAVGVATQGRELGVKELIVSPRERPVDWELIRRLASQGPVWVDGSYRLTESVELARSGARGALFHLSGEIIETAAHPAPG
jgi:uncharacterized protein related to proFAR isomerase